MSGVIDDYTISPQNLGDDFTSYAIDKLLKQNIGIDDSGKEALTNLIAKGTKRIKVSATTAPLIYKSIDRLVDELVLYKSANLEETQLSKIDIDKVLRKICPVWPFC